MQKARYAIGLGIPFLALLSVTFAAAWTGPTAAPPGNNVDQPINVGAASQLKNGGLGVNSISVFGNSSLTGNIFYGVGASRYLNFGVDLTNNTTINNTSGYSGYGLRDNGGTLEFKNSGDTSGAKNGWYTLQGLIYNLCSSGGCNSTRAWVNVSTSRFIGVTYTNSTGHEIEVSATTWGPSHCAAGIYINGGPIYVGYNYINGTAGNQSCNAYATIPNGVTYRLYNDGWSDIQLLSWYELR